MDKLINNWRPRVLSVLRIVASFCFMQHGAQKMFGYPLAQRQDYDLLTMSGIAGALEVFGGALLLVGLFTRPTAFLLSGLMAFAYFIAHAPRGFWPLANGGELAAVYAFLFLYLAFAGGGSWSLDRLRRG